MRTRLSSLATTLRFGWRIQRFELAAVLLLGGAVALADGYVLLQLKEVAPPADCLRNFIADGGELPQGCPSVDEFFRIASDQVGMALAVTLILPFFIGLIPGTSLLASEIEHRTAQLSWMLLPSRRRWLLGRLLPVLLVVLASAAVAAIAGELLVGAAVPWLDSRASFQDYGARGPVLVLRAVAFATIGLLVGALSGRQLPALVISGVLCLALLVFLNVSRPFGEPLTPLPASELTEGSLQVGLRYRAPDGALLTYEDATERGLIDDVEVYDLSDPNNVVIGVPGEGLGAVELRESLLLLAISGAAIAATMVVVQRRRPY